ncbi:hypothetical protein [Phycisphaera mikurensis]|uniref:Uncharacterized protein n=1 Tax=Phycisphaera mikurensis (strain NBRC 102666 / KCTC 22515 / FYK2301M01) TaxID=1142394 RepID=I0IHV9_PHYMF|nr:hypothetical protein [Phycisphaera mikurensis]MBB6441088.1 hypothetical protein [Phycisphaera mikurensis]BAM04847.1 hypothetical protein PSMK_26880 [Phycisphaera mikurensis NBRC 102666]
MSQPAPPGDGRPVRGAVPPPDEVVFHSYPKLIYAWPLIAAGIGFWFLPAAWEATLGWVYLFLVLVTITTLAIDLERNYAFVWSVLFALFFFAGKWVYAAYDVPVFEAVFGFFFDLNTRYDRGFGMALAILLAFPYAVMLVWVRLNSRWRITHNEFEHYAWGRADDSLARGAKRVRSTYPDLLELLLCGAGTLLVYSANGSRELRRIPNVPLLFRVRRKLNLLLESQQVVGPGRREATLAEMAEEEEQDARDERVPADQPPVRPADEPL